ncbi:MAG: DUF1292 domain-containing protein [Firmicutes bacterium]|nr:DUF1292 domain-containing protein [Bacillota bacterium]
MDDKLDIVTLIDEEGDQFEFEVVDLFFVDEHEYAVLLPLHSEAGDTCSGKRKDNGTFEREDAYFDVWKESEDPFEENEEAVILRVLKGDDGETTLHVIEDEEEWQQVADIAFERLLDQEEE